ncbi:hypothetical protein L228DRAFT_282293 [Xylona heveae TC161]|uniref:Uncharacterized protein n=1 Tax=Xylona heveae (strain CBS 132557 / TC161) TaxID=1328760 RepID=A0A165HIT1_XYLHT|nr:hypothetical protein L228DRAFT_282293 [Xylona heveae TC161]KZF23582.1 hypothetical protein L228DRAFT_282293 [Xylona heveae TC161]
MGSPSPLEAHPTLTLHLADTTLYPLTSTNDVSSETASSALNDLTSAYLTTHETTPRFNIGQALRISAELAQNGPASVQTYLVPGDARRVKAGLPIESESMLSKGKQPLPSAGDAEFLEGPPRHLIEHSAAEEAVSAETPGPAGPPALVATVVAPGRKSLQEARDAARQLETIGRAVQMEWLANETDGVNTAGVVENGST